MYMKTGLHCSFITFLKIGSGFLVCPKKSIFHTNTCNGMILIQGMMVKKHIKNTWQEKSFATDLFSC